MKKIIGFKDIVIRIKELEDDKEIVGIIYPGQSYYLTAPSLYYLHQIFNKHHIHYLGIDTQYGDIEEFLKADLNEKEKWIDSDSIAIGEFISRETEKYKKRLFIAKSLGTAHLYNQLRNKIINEDDILILQTPIIPFNELQDCLISSGNKSLIIYGTKDPIMIKRNLGRIKSKDNTEVIEIDNAGHCFENDELVEKSINNLKEVMLGIDDFIARSITD